MQQRGQLFCTHALAPPGERGAIKRQFVLEEFLAAQQLVIRVFQPALAQHLVRQIVHVFEDRQAGHQSRRQRRPARDVAVDRSQLLLEEAPIDAEGQFREWMCRINDLVEPGPQQVVLAALASLLGSHRIARLLCQRDGITPCRVGSICRKTHFSPQFSGNHGFSQREKYLHLSRLWRFFTGDSLFFIARSICWPVGTISCTKPIRYISAAENSSHSIR